MKFNHINLNLNLDFPRVINMLLKGSNLFHDSSILRVFYVYIHGQKEKGHVVATCAMLILRLTTCQKCAETS